ncbi:uncharacterized protein LOC120397268 [Mauremys reevesii]|uniref:uncharacterized protein LOC120397268 n=1 Tax=Mauremys reevesii TaxID=260615 RepID=UPI00193FBD66|nr:uncharacterized protein LOC120397268 [Mauremys reevesii]
MTTAPVMPLVGGGGSTEVSENVTGAGSHCGFNLVIWSCRTDTRSTIHHKETKENNGEAQVLVQSQLSITKAEDRTARIDCHVSGISLSSAYMHWYRQRPDAALERILYFSSGKPVFDQDSEKGKFEAEKQLSKSTCTLTVKKTTTSDSATYYCAAWDHTALKNHSHSVQKPTLYSQLQSFKYIKPQLPPNPASHDRTRPRNPLLVSATRDKKQQNCCSHKFCKQEDPTCVCQTNNKTT